MLRSLIPYGPLAKPVRNLFFIGLFFHVLAAWFTIGYHHPDEYFQIIEFASYKLGLTSSFDLAWEFRDGIRPALQPAMVYALCKLTTLTNPVVVSFLLRLLSSVAAWVVSVVFVLIALREFHSDKTKKIVLYLATFLWFLPYIHSRFSSENWSAVFFFAGLCLLMLQVKPWSEGAKTKQGIVLLVSGVLLGLSFITRFQTGFMIMGLGLWLVVYGRLSFRDLSLLFIGIVTSFIIGVLIDNWFYDRLIFTSVNYFRVNIMQGKTGYWGTSPWWEYFKMMFDNLIPPFSILFLAGIFIFFLKGQKHLLTWVCLPFLLAHVLIGHKELRFLFPLSMALPVVVGLTLEATGFAWMERFRPFLFSRVGVIFSKIFLGANILLLLVASVKPANEAFLFYNYMYEFSKDKKTVLYTIINNPYENLAVGFYKPFNLTTARLQDDLLRCKIIYNEHATNLVLTEGFYAGDVPRPPGKKAVLVYQSIPGWLTDFNFNNWLSHSRIWRVYRLE